MSLVNSGLIILFFSSDLLYCSFEDELFRISIKLIAYELYLSLVGGLSLGLHARLYQLSKGIGFYIGDPLFLFLYRGIPDNVIDDTISVLALFQSYTYHLWPLWEFPGDVN